MNVLDYPKKVCIFAAINEMGTKAIYTIHSNPV